MMNTTHRFCIKPFTFVLVFLLTVGGGRIFGQSDTPADVEALVKQLAGEDFKEREAAAKGLEEAGSVAVPALIEAAVGDGDFEVKQRALQILKRLSSASEDATVAALNEVAESGAEESVEIARSMLKLSNTKRSGEIPIEDFVIPGMAIEQVDGGISIKTAGGGTIRLSNKGGGGGGFQRSQLRMNGNSIIAGRSDGKQVLVASDAEGVIRMSVTETVDGEKTTRAYQYRSEAEFEEKNAELFGLYSRFKAGGKVPRIEGLPR